jgi:hypothetical protein
MFIDKKFAVNLGFLFVRDNFGAGQNFRAVILSGP